MSNAIPQRVITVSLTTITGGDTDLIKARYSYASPVSGLVYQNSPKCDLKVVQATDCLFVLDFQSTSQGWTITDITAAGTSPLIPFTRGPKKLSILTSDPYTLPPPDAPLNPVYTTYQFYIWYQNTLTGVCYKEDPQEGNGPP